MAQDSYPSSARASGALSDVEYETLVSPFYPSGILGTPDDLYPVYCDNSGTRSVHFRALSRGLVRGTYYAEGSTDTSISAAANATGSDRYDLAVWRLDRATSGSPVRAALVTGTSNPAGPAPTQNDVSNSAGKWEHPIGIIKVPNGAAVLASSAVDEIGYYIAPPTYITRSDRGRPSAIKGQKIYEWDTVSELTADGSDYTLELADSGDVPLSAAANWVINAGNPPNYISVRKVNGLVLFNFRVTRTTSNAPIGSNPLVCTIPDGFRPTRVIYQAVYLGGNLMLAEIGTTGAVTIAGGLSIINIGNQILGYETHWKAA